LRHRLLALSGRPAQTVIVGYHAPIICVSTDPDYQDPPFRMYDVDVLLNAIRELWNEGIDFLTVFVGRTSPTVRKLARFERRLVLTGYIDRAELFDWVGSFDIGTYPRTVDFSRGQSVKLLEYMASGAAIVAMMSSETSYLREAALGAVVDEVDDFCSALRELITNPDVRRTFANRGREFTAAHDWNRLAARYEAVLADAIDSA
jgi:glycosyltransferase involved in cell wall biosynthesis